MSVLKSDYNPEVRTCPIHERYRYEIRNAYNIDFESHVLNIEILADHKYTDKELADFLEPQINARVYPFHGCVVIKKLYKMAYVPDMMTEIVIYLADNIAFGPYIPVTDGPTIGNGRISDMYKKNTEVHYGIIGH